MTGGVSDGSHTVTGQADPCPSCTSGEGVTIYQCTAGNCTVGSATPIGGPLCPDPSTGAFTITLTTQLVCGDFVFGFDSCTQRMGPLYKVSCPAPVPAMSARMIGVLAGTLALIGLFGLLRLRRDL